MADENGRGDRRDDRQEIPEILILMTMRDGARWLGAQLDSIAAQEGCRWALRISDDGSRDESRALAAEFAARHPDRDIRLHDWRLHDWHPHDRNRTGPEWRAAAHSMALLSRPDLPLGPHTLVALADQDDLWLPDKLARACALLARAGERPALCGAQSLHVDTRGRIIGHSRPPAGQVTLPRLLVHNPIPGHALVLNPAAVALARRVGPVPVAFHDWWLGLLVLACGGRALIDPEPVLHYRQHRDNLLGAPGGIAAGLRRAGLVLGGRWRGWIAANLAALAALPAEIPRAPAAGALLAALAHTPRRGPGRARSFARLGLRREGRAGDALLQLALLAGLA